MNLAGLLAWLTVEHLPIPRSAGQWYEDSTGEEKRKVVKSAFYCSFTHLTATGIAPDLHRTSLLMAPQRQPNTGQR